MNKKTRNNNSIDTKGQRSDERASEGSVNSNTGNTVVWKLNYTNVVPDKILLGSTN